MNTTTEMLEETPPPAYFGSLTIENVKCFQGEHTIDLSDRNGNPAMWTVILGDNNTGKTTLLRCLADLEPIEIKVDDKKNELNFYPKYLRKLSIRPVNSKVFSILFIQSGELYIKQGIKWGYEENRITKTSNRIKSFIVYGYGISRRMSNTSLNNNENQDNSETLFEDNLTLINSEEWLLQIDYSNKNGIESAKSRLDKIKTVLTSGLLPDVKDFRCVSREINNKFKNFVEVETDFGWVKLRELGYGYQTTLAWIVDFAKKMFERYPNSENPLEEPAIVLVDEIDLHLHPEWQRKIIQYLKTQFPRTQFIVTTHSPLIVQSLEEINLVLLEKEKDHVVIRQPDLKTYKGWTVEEILSDLMGLEGKTKTEAYSTLLHQFNKAALEDDYCSAKQIYDELNRLLNVNNPYRELLSLQLNALSEPETA